MIQKTEHFDLEELVCPHVFYRYKEQAWQFFDQKFLILEDWLRNKINRPVYLNNWMHDYKDSDFVVYIRETIKAGKPLIFDNIPKAPALLLSQCGIRCPLCELNYKKATSGILYMSGHSLGKAGDNEVQGMLAEEVRQFIVLHQKELPFNIRLEEAVSWVHMDTEDAGQKIFTFKG